MSGFFYRLTWLRATIDDDPLRHRAQPRQLALAQLARGEDALVAHRGVVRRAVEILPRLPVADTAHRRHVETQVAARAQALHFIDETGREHRVEARGDPRVQYAAVGRLQRDRHEAVGRRLVLRARRGEQRRHRLAGQREHFERALDALRVVRREARGGARIDGREPRVQRGPAVAGGVGIERRAHFLIRGGQIVQALGQGLEIQHRAADEQRHVAPRIDFTDKPQRVGAEIGGGIGVGGVDDVDQMMRRERAFAGGRLRGADIHAAIHQRRIDAHDFDRPARGKGERGGGLARRRRPEQARDRAGAAGRRRCLRSAHRRARCRVHRVLIARA